MKKSELKKIIKECLVELLAEGLSPRNVGGFTDQLSEAAQSSTSQRLQPTQTLNRKSAAPTPYRAPPVIKDAIREVAGGDNIMADIFADTARTTLQDMIGAEARGGHSMVAEQGDKAAKLADVSDPIEMFGQGAAASWAALAFADNKKLPNS